MNDATDAFEPADAGIDTAGAGTFDVVDDVRNSSVDYTETGRWFVAGRTDRTPAQGTRLIVGAPPEEAVPTVAGFRHAVDRIRRAEGRVPRHGIIRDADTYDALPDWLSGAVGYLEPAVDDEAERLLRGTVGDVGPDAHDEFLDAAAAGTVDADARRRGLNANRDQAFRYADVVADSLAATDGVSTDGVPRVGVADQRRPLAQVGGSPVHAHYAPFGRRSLRDPNSDRGPAHDHAPPTALSFAPEVPGWEGAARGLEARLYADPAVDDQTAETERVVEGIWGTDLSLHPGDAVDAMVDAVAEAAAADGVSGRVKRRLGLRRGPNRAVAARAVRHGGVADLLDVDGERRWSKPSEIFRERKTNWVRNTGNDLARAATERFAENVATAVNRDLIGRVERPEDLSAAAKSRSRQTVTERLRAGLTDGLLQSALGWTAGGQLRSEREPRDINVVGRLVDLDGVAPRDGMEALGVAMLEDRGENEYGWAAVYEATRAAHSGLVQPRDEGPVDSRLLADLFVDEARDLGGDPDPRSAQVLVNGQLNAEEQVASETGRWETLKRGLGIGR